MAILPSAVSATDVPWRPTAPVLTSLFPCCRPDTGTAGGHPRRAGGAKAEGHRSSPRCGIAVGGQRDGHALTGASHSVDADELLALLRPDTAAAGYEYERLSTSKR